ncbi:MAG TPA: LysR substrate-binding domain-containing protein, partial [Streptomyces sp.]
QDQLAMLPRGHRLAGRAALVLADLDGEPFPRWPGSDVNGPEVRDPGQLLQLIALGQVVAIVPESARRHIRADVVCLPVLDAPRTSVLLAWPDRTSSRAVAAFVRAATDVRSPVAP